jgi:hypothetical protein
MKTIQICDDCIGEILENYPSCFSLYVHICDVTKINKCCHIGIYGDFESKEYIPRLKFLEQSGYIITTESAQTKDVIRAKAFYHEDKNNVYFCRGHNEKV